MEGSNFKRIAKESLFVSEPEPWMFGNEENERNNAAWTNPNWLKSRFHFNFAEHRSGPRNFGVLRVVNDDLVQPRRGFGKHGHGDMEIVTIVVSGELTHADSMHNSESLGRGSIQFMSAGRGVQHSEQNRGDVPVRFIQCWVTPRNRGSQPNYGSLPESEPRKAKRNNQFEHVVGDKNNNQSEAPVRIDQDCNFSLGEFEAGTQGKFEVAAGRKAYILQIEGRAATLEEGDAATVDGPFTYSFDVHTKSFILVIDVLQ